jgi:beta-fructofuranosidase
MPLFYILKTFPFLFVLFINYYRCRMSLLSIIQNCACIHNVLGVLIPDLRIIIESREFELLSAKAKQQAYNLTPKQVTYQQTVI